MYLQLWDQMTLDEETSMTTMNNLFCSMHIVGIADVAASTLVQWESPHFEENPPFQSKFSRKSESGMVRLIRTTCKASMAMSTAGYIKHLLLKSN